MGKEKQLELIEKLVDLGIKIDPPTQVDGEYIYFIDHTKLTDEAKELIRNYNEED